jgi:hypothetical protein
MDLFFAVDGSLAAGGFGQVLLAIDEAEELYKKLDRFFGEKKPVSSAAPLAPFPKIDVPPLSPVPAPPSKTQKEIEDMLREFGHKKRPYDWFPTAAPLPPYYCPPPSSFDPGLPGIKQDVICSFNPNMTAAAVVDYDQVAKNSYTFSAPPVFPKKGL